MRIGILQKPATPSMDGIQVDHLYPGCLYRVGKVISR